MDFKHICITGGAGFVGSNLARSILEHHPDCKVTACDSLKRRGSELNLQRLRNCGAEFLHCDIRCPEDLETLPAFDLMIDCSAEPSVQSGVGESPAYVLNTNLTGTINCLEATRKRGAAFLFLSTSRIYPIDALNSLSYTETDTRFELCDEQVAQGASGAGVTEAFSLEGGGRSYYGASKLAGEVVAQEYAFNHGMPLMINRCGVIAGPWQMGKVDQGVVTLWVARHHFRMPLRYIGFGGMGKQVRDVIHVDDVFALLDKQMSDTSVWDGRVYNVGGGLSGSTSLLELTSHCREITGNEIEIISDAETSHVDVRNYTTDSAKAHRDFGWQPQKGIAEIVADTERWLCDNEDALAPILGNG